MTAIFQVDSFATEPYGGNPAAVCLPDGPPEPAWMQKVAREMNLSETAFTWPDGDRFQLRWFTPGSEVPLCGHATLAAAHVLWETGRASGGLRFETLSGTLAARPDGDDVLIDLPGQPVRPAALPEEIQESFATARFVGRTPDRGLDDVDYLIELDTAAAVLDLSPPLDALRRVPGGFIVTARADTGGQDYVCRYFAPWFGIDEDPVTGAAHCALAPYWGARLGREELSGLQASHRPGLVRCRVDGDRVLLMGGAVTVLRGELLH